MYNVNAGSIMSDHHCKSNGTTKILPIPSPLFHGHVLFFNLTRTTQTIFRKLFLTKYSPGDAQILNMNIKVQGIFMRKYQSTRNRPSKKKNLCAELEN